MKTASLRFPRRVEKSILKGRLGDIHHTAIPVYPSLYNYGLDTFVINSGVNLTPKQMVAALFSVLDEAGRETRLAVFQATSQHQLKRAADEVTTTFTLKPSQTLAVRRVIIPTRIGMRVKKTRDKRNSKRLAH